MPQQQQYQRNEKADGDTRSLTPGSHVERRRCHQMGYRRDGLRGRRAMKIDSDIHRDTEAVDVTTQSSIEKGALASPLFKRKARIRLSTATPSGDIGLSA